MPLYEYKCRSCGKTFEVIQKFADEPLKTHLECGGIVEKLFSAPAFHLKGTGWYATDYAKGNGKSAQSEEAKAESKSEKPESKPSTTESKAPTAASSETKSSSETKPKPSPAT